jgi:anti-sigma regulatory factor (Ser/Thr protein kinase)
MQPTLQQQVVEIPANVTAPARARRLCERACRAWSMEGLIAECDLLVSELVTNAVVHGSGPIVLEIGRRDRGVSVSVTDGACTGPVAAQNVLDDAEGGRGLAIVATVAARWGSHRDEQGTRVWFELGQ